MSAVYKMDTEEPEIVVLDTTSEHVRALGGNLRQRDLEMAGRAGIPAHRALWRIYKQSLFCKTVFINGQVAAIWGITGTFLGQKGKPWLVASPLVEDYPMKLAFRYRSELRSMLKYFPVLEDWVEISDSKTMRLLELVGFSFGEPEEIGENKIMFLKATLSRREEG